MLDEKEDTRNVLRAIEIILDRSVGKPLQQVEQTNINTDITMMSEAERKAKIKELLERMQ